MTPPSLPPLIVPMDLDGGGSYDTDEMDAIALDSRRQPCRCKPWVQRWRAESPHRCVTCGGLFPAHTVEARRG